MRVDRDARIHALSGFETMLMRSSTQQTVIPPPPPELGPVYTDRTPDGPPSPDGPQLWRAYTAALAVAADVASVFAGTAAALFGWEILRGHRFPNDGVLLLSVGLQYSLLIVLLAKAYYLYAYTPCLLQIRDTANVIRISVFSMIAVAVSIFYSHIVVPRLVLTAAWLFVTVILICQKHLMRSVVSRLTSNSAQMRRAIIYGVGSDARRLYSCLNNSKHMGVIPAAFVGRVAGNQKRAIYQHDYRFREFAPVVGDTLTDELVSSMNITDVFITRPSGSGEEIEEINEVCALAAKRRLNLSFVGSTVPYLREEPASAYILDNLLITSYKSWDSGSFIYDSGKRLFDCLGAAILLVFSAPLWLIAAIAVKLSSPGPIIFQQERVGRNGRLFQMLKFRSMYADAAKYDKSPEDSADPRITRAGQFLRKTSLDELPQLWNVLRGDMSLVGPRPEMPQIVEGYNAQERIRLSVPQGLTGIWQLSADRKLPIHESIEYDLYYIENRGFFIDLAVLVHTLIFAMKGI
jgi:exopolysaccharide biosynthesis polyprenyl glycosylphosphotransferase